MPNSLRTVAAVVTLVAWCTFAPAPAVAQDECQTQVVGRFVPATTANVKKAVFYFPWYPPAVASEATGCPAVPDATNSVWCRCVLRGKQPAGARPAIGLYDSSNAATIRTHLRQIRDAGVRVIGIEWGGTHRAGTQPVHVTAQNTPTVISVLNEPEFSDLRFVILYDSAIALGSDLDFGPASPINPLRAGFLADMQDIAPYLPLGRYLNIDNKPVLYLYISRAYAGDLPSLATQLRQKTGEIYLVADELYWGPSQQWSSVGPVRLAQMGANAATAFHGMDPLQIPYRSTANYPDYTTRPMKAIAEAVVKEVYSPRRADILSGGANVNIHPGVWPQYSDAGTSGPLCSEISRDPARVLTEELKPGTGLDDWKFMLEKVGRDQQWVLERTQVGADCSVTALPKEDSSVVWAYSFNEWFEGAGIEPLEQKAGDFPYGFGDKLISTLGGDTSASSSTKPVVAAPLLRAPKGSQDTRRPTFAYDGVHNATEYEIEVRKADGSLVLSRTSAATVFVPRPVSGSATINGENGLDLPYATNYEWRVRAANGTGTGPWSEYQLFSTPSSSGTPSCGNLVCDEAAGEDADNCPDDCETGPGTNACTLLGPSPQSFTWSGGVDHPTVAVAGAPVSFNANTAAMTPGAPILWDVGTGAHPTGNPLSYTYATAGTYSVTLTSNDLRCGSTVLTTLALNVTPVPSQTCSQFASQYNYTFVGCGGWEQDCTNHPGASPVGSGSDCPGTVCCVVPGPPPPPPDTQSCGQLGGDYCSNTSSCPSPLYESLGTTRQNGGVECQTCCNQLVGDGYCEPYVEDCGTSPSDCPCWMAGTTCNASGSPGQCVDRCSDPAYHNHTGSCGEPDECGHPIGTIQECQPSCGAMGGDYCSQSGSWCPGGYGYLGQSWDCASCCQLDPCASPYTHDHGGSCGSTDSCGHSFGSNEDCGCPGAATEWDTCWDYQCDTGWSWEPDYCDTCEQQCTTEWSCWTNCDEWGCWDECQPYDSCWNNCYSYECGGHWAPYDYNCRWEPYQCNPHQCGN